MAKIKTEYETPIPEEDAISKVSEVSANSNSIENKTAENAGIYVYLGPTVRGVCNHGRIFKGTKSAILAEIKGNAEAVGMLKRAAKMSRLLIKDTEVAHANEKLAQGGNALSEAYKAIEEG